MTQKFKNSFQFSMFLSLIRALFPNWNFFDRIAYHFELEFKISGSKTWESISFDQKRHGLSLFFNSECNEAMAQINILEHFARDIQELQIANPSIHSKDVQKLTTFKMIRSLLKAKIHEYELSSDTVQFKIQACSPTEKVDLYISDWILLGPA